MARGCVVCGGRGDVIIGKPGCSCSKYADSYYDRVVPAAGDREAKQGDSKPATSILDTQVAGEHYKYLKPQPIEVIEAWGIGFHLGAALKYIARAGKKPGNNAKQDIEKAIWFLRRYCEVSDGVGRTSSVEPA